MKDLFGSKPDWPATLGGIPALRDHRLPVPSLWVARVLNADDRNTVGPRVVEGVEVDPLIGWADVHGEPHRSS